MFTIARAGRSETCRIRFLGYMISGRSGFGVVSYSDRFSSFANIRPSGVGRKGLFLRSVIVPTSHRRVVRGVYGGSSPCVCASISVTGGSNRPICIRYATRGCRGSPLYHLIFTSISGDERGGEHLGRGTGRVGRLVSLMAKNIYLFGMARGVRFRILCLGRDTYHLFKASGSACRGRICEVSRLVRPRSGALIFRTVNDTVTANSRVSLIYEVGRRGSGCE